ncbi:MAG: hypothetical protein LBR80_07725 [Deltaproteobacteria bacterium]|nr:hypothetical protein [Deltaproteobacteria bacterium]
MPDNFKSTDDDGSGRPEAPDTIDVSVVAPDCATGQTEVPDVGSEQTGAPDIAVGQKETPDAEARQKESPDAATWQMEAPDGAAGRKEVSDDAAGRKEAEDDAAGRQEAPDAGVGRQEAPDVAAGRKEAHDGATDHKGASDGAVGKKVALDAKSGRKESPDSESEPAHSAPTAVLYAPSGGFRIEALFLIPLAGVAAAAALSPLFAASVAISPLVFANIVLSLAYGLAAGLLSCWAVSASHARCPVLAAALSALGCAVGFWLAFVGWVGTLYGLEAQVSRFLETASAAAGGSVDLAVRPDAAVGLALDADASPWIFMGQPVTGSWALAVWVLQWLAFTAGACLPAFRRASRPFSEEAGVWLERLRPATMRLALPDGASEPQPELIEAIRGGDLGDLLKAPRAAVGQASLEFSFLSRDEAPLAAATVRFIPAKGSKARGKVIVKDALVPREFSEGCK